MIRAKNFHAYCTHLRRTSRKLGIGYLDPCDAVMRRRFGEVDSFSDLIEPDGYHGTDLYYEYCARVIAGTIGASRLDGRPRAIA